MASIKVKIFGERNTATNALKQLIEQNSDSICLPGTEDELNPFLLRVATSRFSWPYAGELIKDFVFLGRSPLHAWKHCAPDFEDARIFKGVTIIFTVRHPASWLLSLFNSPYHRLGPMPVDVEAFMHSRWKTVSRERLSRRSFTPIELYMVKLRTTLEFAKRLSEAGIENRFIRHEDMVLRQGQVLSEISENLFNPRHNPAPLTLVTKGSSRTLDQIKAYYTREDWRLPLRGLETTINEQINWAEVARFNYLPL